VVAVEAPPPGGSSSVELEWWSSEDCERVEACWVMKSPPWTRTSLSTTRCSSTLRVGLHWWWALSSPHDVRTSTDVVCRSPEPRDSVVVYKRTTVNQSLKTAISHINRLMIPRLHDEANMKQTYSEYMCTTCALSLLHVCFMFLLNVCLMFVWCLLHVCFIFASCLLPRVNGVLHVTQD